MQADRVSQTLGTFYRDSGAAVNGHFLQHGICGGRAATRGVIDPAAVGRPRRAEARVRNVAQIASIRIHQPDSKRQPLVAARRDERNRAAVRRPYRDAHRHAWIALVSDLAQLTALGVHHPQVGVAAAVGEKRDFVVAGARRRREDLPGLPSDTNALAHIFGRRTIDRKLQISVCILMRPTAIAPLRETSGVTYGDSPEVIRLTFPSRNVTSHRPSAGR